MTKLDYQLSFSTPPIVLAKRLSLQLKINGPARVSDSWVIW
jgi:hypothetical protein